MLLQLLLFPSSAITIREVLSKVSAQVFPCTTQHPFHFVNNVIINLDTLVPSYFSESETLWHLAKIVLDPQEQAGSTTGPKVEIIDKLPPLKSPKKRRARRPHGPLDVSFLRRSKRLNVGLEGFRDANSGA